MRSLRHANLLLAFMIEVGMLAAFCYAGWASTHIVWLRLVLAVGLPGLAIVLWAVWAAPKAGKRRLKMPALLVFKIAILRQRQRRCGPRAIWSFATRRPG